MICLTLILLSCVLVNKTTAGSDHIESHHNLEITEEGYYPEDNDEVNDGDDVTQEDDSISEIHDVEKREIRRRRIKKPTKRRLIFWVRCLAALSFPTASLLRMLMILSSYLKRLVRLWCSCAIAILNLSIS